MSADTVAFRQALAAQSLVPLWDIYDSLVTHEPRPACEPAFWRYREVRPLLSQAGREVSTDVAERRVLLFKNPALQRPFTTATVACGLQLLLGGEIEGSHRHSQAALRLVIEGDGAYTTTGGERIWMKPGDVITTPSWTWHDHGKTSDGEMVWLDGIDVPLVDFLRATFAEFMSADGERRQSLARPDSDSHYRYGSGLLPIGPLPASAHSPIYAYPYE
ncbi:MAG: cupin domain-containing protein, partial [Steroidobacteraceae bacterium]